MNKFLPLLSAFIFSLAAVNASAQDDNGINTQLELGALFTSGNTEDESIQFKGSVDWIRDAWTYGLSVDGLRSSTSDLLTAQRFYYVANTNYALNENSFILTQLTHDKDKFSGYDSQSGLTVNYGRNLLLNRSNMNLTFNIGAGMRRSTSDLEDFNEGILRLAGDYQWAISDTANFRQTLSSESGNETSIFRSESSIETKIMDNLSLKFAIKVKHQTEVPIGREKTDTETGITLVLNF